ncbi:hypothetical protein NT2_06_02460 [Caenibius tardaugens NBRC 16725]|uniref:EamA domain-containing protein n=1 Tax=Caenibius tardaugens NBRC 16725 TaxID=1219035 RepID=U2Y962_9SPHN|nr:DMT family transporter [Caenibius tardaugens]AZI37658.1 DMT family transporter [Caenibius tardaugens NBRC 16725]GAD49806.1 hypothetical protein NT2_06_02460 [Caenibius tardaugens NBRC 16725]
MPAHTQVSNQTRWLSYASLVFVMLFWSGNFVVGRAVQGAIPPFTLALVRWSGAVLLVLPFAWPKLRADWQILRQHWRIILLLGVAGVGGFNGFVYSGLHFTTASNGLLLQAATPALVLLFNLLFFRLRSPVLQIAGVLLSMLGVVLIVLRGHLAAILTLHFNLGDLLILCGVTCWAAYTSLLRIRPPCHPLSFLVATFVIGAVTMAPFALWEHAQGLRVQFSAGTLCAFAYVAVFPSLIAYLLYNAAVRDLGAGPAGQTITLMPLFGAFLASALLDERLQSFHLIGMAIILGGIILGAAASKRTSANDGADT